MDARLRILILDDEPLVLRMLERVVRDHVVISVEDPTAALAMLDPECIDAVLCDGHMPKMSGEEFARAVQDADFPPERFAVMTGDFVLADRLSSLGHRVVEKPLAPEHLDALIEAWRNLRKASGAA